MGKCWTCHRRRLKCDEHRPKCRKCQAHGVECLGYEKRLTWVGGMARRGRLKDHGDGATPTTWKISRDQSILCTKYAVPHSPSTALASAVKTPGAQYAAFSPTFSRHLVDPMLQDLDVSRRFFIDYYEKRVCPALMLYDSTSNRWRGLISMIGESPGVANAVLALATCHFAHGMRGGPMCSSINKKWKSTPSGIKKTFVLDLNTVRPGILQCLYIFKNRALQCLSNALADPINHDQNANMAIVALLLLEEVFETGSGSWNVHLEGAKRLLEAKITTGHLNGFVGLERVIDDLRLFETFGSTFVRPGLFSPSLRSRFNMTLVETPEHTAVGCPHEIQIVIDFVTTQRFSDALVDPADDSSDASGLDIPALYSALDQLHNFDSLAWATKLIAARTSHLTVSIHDLFHICEAWKLAAFIYTNRVISKLIAQPDLPLPELVDGLMKELKSCESDGTILKSLLWPTFIAGTECGSAEQREWVLSAMYKLWQLLLCANTIQATLLLTSLWNRQDMLKEQGGDATMNVWGLINELSRSDDHCLIL